MAGAVEAQRARHRTVCYVRAPTFCYEVEVSNIKPHYMLSFSTGLRAPVYSACNSTLECMQHYVRVRAMEYRTSIPISICKFFYNEYLCQA